MAYDLDDYIDVADRIGAFYEKFPEGSLQGSYEVCEVGDKTFIVYRAEAYRGAEDNRPGVGTAWEVFPGTTNWTKDSELMNAETSAWGRAIAALGFEVRKGIASKQEVRNRSGNGTPTAKDNLQVSDKQLDLIERIVKEAGADNPVAIRSYSQAKLTGGREGSASKAIDALMNKERKGEATAQLAEATEKWQAKQQEMPAEQPEPVVAGDPGPDVPF